ncbi:hypothetical protein D3C76_1197060 [compost metagenome]
MIVKIKTIPTLIRQTHLPFMKNIAQLRQRPRGYVPFAVRTRVHIHMLELEYHLQLFAFLVRVKDGIFNCSARGFADSHNVIVG